jgi:UDP-N-acetylglucosamine 2-epimerase
MKCVTIAGTRPEFIQTSRVSHVIREHHTEIFVNTGQHYDDAMSQVFFRELDIPKPDFDLNVGVDGAGHAAQTAAVMVKLEPLLVRERPDWVIVFGDTNSTIAAALTAAKLHLPVAHIEAGLRSFDRKMPEEVNRILTDHLSQVLFSPTETAVKNLAREGITEGVVNVGDVRVDVLSAFAESARARAPGLLERAKLTGGADFALVTIHRASNTDDPKRLSSIVAALNELSVPAVLPVHPRLGKMLERFGLALGPNVRPLEPLGFLDLLALLQACRIVVTDSGGLQKEAYMLERPCVTVRDTTEWTETVDAGWNELVEPPVLAAAVTRVLGAARPAHSDLYGTPGVSQRIVDVLASRR